MFFSSSTSSRCFLRWQILKMKDTFLFELVHQSIIPFPFAGVAYLVPFLKSPVQQSSKPNGLFWLKEVCFSYLFFCIWTSASYYMFLHSFPYLLSTAFAWHVEECWCWQLQLRTKLGQMWSNFWLQHNHGFIWCKSFVGIHKKCQIRQPPRQQGNRK